MADPKQLTNLRVSALNVSSTRSALVVHSVDESGAYVSPGAGSTQVSIRGILSSSGGSLVDSSNVSLGVTIRAGSAAGTEYTQGDIDATITGTAQLVEGASDTLQPVQGSTGTPSTGSFGVWVREIPSTRVLDVSPVAGSTFNVRPLQSSQADLRITAYQSTAGDFLATARINTSSGGAVEGSTTTLSTGGVLGLNVREVQPSGRQSTTLVITSTHSTARYEVISSAAGLRHKVYAYFVGSTHTNPSSLVFQSSGVGGNAGADRWCVNFGSGSSGITGANLALTPPGFVFQTDASEPLSVRLEGGNSTVTSTTVVRLSLSWFTEA